MVLEELMFTQRESFRYCQQVLAQTLRVSVPTVERAISRLKKANLIQVIHRKDKINTYDFTPLIIHLEELSNKDIKKITVPNPEPEETKELSDIITNNTEYFGKWCDRDLQVQEYQTKVDAIWEDMKQEEENTKITFQATKEEEKKVEWNEYFENEISKALDRNYKHLTPKGETPLEKAKWCLKEDYKDRQGASLHMVKMNFYNNLGPEEFDKMLEQNKLEEFKLLSENTYIVDGIWMITVYIGGDIPIEMSLLEYTGMDETDFNLFKEIHEFTQKSKVSIQGN